MASVLSLGYAIVSATGIPACVDDLDLVGRAYGKVLAGAAPLASTFGTTMERSS